MNNEMNGDAISRRRALRWLSAAPAVAVGVLSAVANAGCDGSESGAGGAGGRPDGAEGDGDAGSNDLTDDTRDLSARRDADSSEGRDARRDLPGRNDPDSIGMFDSDSSEGLDARPDADLRSEPDVEQVCELTGSDVAGPFFEEGAPDRTVLADLSEPGDRIFIRGVVRTSDCRTPIAGALMDVWHADDEGNYFDAPNYKLRGQMLTDEQGRFAFESIRPGNYETPSGMRPAHIHFTISHPAAATLTTQLYFAGDPFLAPNDSCGGCNSGDPTLIIDLTRTAQGLEGVFDVVLADA